MGRRIHFGFDRDDRNGKPMEEKVGVGTQGVEGRIFPRLQTLAISNVMQLRKRSFFVSRMEKRRSYGFVEVENFVTIIDRIEKGAEQPKEKK